MELKRDNHFVPRFYLKHWVDHGGRIWVYRILVSHEKVPTWTRKTIENVAFRRDLYTLTSGGQEVDAHERWIESEFETPAKESLDRAIGGHSMTKSDWDRLAMLLAAQDLRTPNNLIETMKRWDKDMPDLLDTTLRSSVAHLKRAHAKGKPLDKSPRKKTPFDNVFDVKVHHAAEGEKEGSIEVGVVLGRKLWIAGQNQLLTGVAKVLSQHKWSIAEPASGTSWFTSDHPVVRLNYSGENQYDLKGGWGVKNGDLMMPLSPQHLLFTTIGREAPDRFTFSDVKTTEIQQILASRAHRCILADRPMKKVKWFRPRHVNADAYQSEERQWANYHRDQSAVE